MSAATRAVRPITPEDIRAKFRQIQGEVTQVGESARTTALVVGAVAVVAVVGAAFWLGRRRGRQQRTVVEVRRV